MYCWYSILHLENTDIQCTDKGTSPDAVYRCCLPDHTAKKLTLVKPRKIGSMNAGEIRKLQKYENYRKMNNIVLLSKNYISTC